MGRQVGGSARVSSAFPLRVWLRYVCAVLALMGAPWLGRGRSGALE